MFEGVLKKMDSEWGDPIRYYLRLDSDFLIINALIGKEISLSHIGYQCLGCGTSDSIFRQGFCKECFFSSPQAADWIMRPELSKAHLGIADRDLEYEKRVQLQPHIVYLANTGKPKVGVTRKTQVPTRWIDQGAEQALSLLEVPNRYLAGVAEVALKAFISDKTSWRTMLSQPAEAVNLQEIFNQLKPHLPQELSPYLIAEATPLSIVYPITSYPQQIKRLDWNSTSYYKGVLSGIKGQYLIFEDDTVFNVRNFEGYRLKWSW